jgi:predicted dehydrogenase
MGAAPNKTVRWGVLGNATIARKCVIPAMRKSENGRVRALATRHPEKAAKLAEENHIERLYDRYEAVLADEEVDAVYIPLPNHLHHGWTLKALQAGKHVLCEKPLACSAVQAREMVSAAADTGRLMMEAFMYRFHPRSRRIRQILREGVIGKPLLIRSAFCYGMAEETLRSGENFRLQPQTGGGALLDVGCYGVSVARWLYGEEPVSVQAQAVYSSQGVDVHMAAVLRFPNGQLATVEASFVSALQQTYSVICSNGAVELPHDAFIPWEKDAVFTIRGAAEEHGKVHLVPGADEYQLMVEHFSRALLGEGPLDVAPAESVQNMIVLDALAAAAKTGKTVEL